MSETPVDSLVDQVVREGLAAVPVRAPAADFDGHVLAAVRRRSWWQAPFGSALTRVLTAALCSAVVMAMLLHRVETTPIALPSATRRVPVIDKHLADRADSASAGSYIRLLPTDRPW